MPILDTRYVYRIWVNTEPVTYFVRTNGVLSASGVVLPTTKRLVIKKDFLPPDSFLLSMDVQWCFANVELAAVGIVEPKEDDVFKDGDNVRWVIKKVEDHDSSFKVSCRKLQGVA